MFNSIVTERLGYILESLQLILNRFEGIEKNTDFISTEKGVELKDSITMRLQIIGENTKRVEKQMPDFFEEYLQTYPEPIIRFRDFISHHYEKTDYEIIFDICKTYIPDLQNKVGYFLNNLPSGKCEMIQEIFHL